MAKKSKTKNTERCGLVVRRYPTIFFPKKNGKTVYKFLVRKSADFIEGLHAEQPARSSMKSADFRTKKYKAFFFRLFLKKNFGGYLRTARPHLSVVFVFDFFAIHEFCYLTPGFSRYGWLCLTSHAAQYVM